GGVLSLGLALVPGFPWPVFLAFGIPMTGIALWNRRHDVPILQGVLTRVGINVGPRPATPIEAPTADTELAPLPTVVLEGGPELVTASTRESLRTAAERAADRLREEFGAPITPPIVRVVTDLSGTRYRLWAFGICVAEAEEVNELEEV